MLTILFDGFAYGMLLFVLACGLAVTLGLMNFINLAHGAFAMAGGYITVVLVNKLGWPFLASLPLAFMGAAAIGALLEATLYRRVYGCSHLDQVLFTIGLVFMSVAAVDYFAGPSQVSREQWEKIVTTMMEVRVSAAGQPEEPRAFALARDDAWETWNRERDEGKR